MDDGQFWFDFAWSLRWHDAAADGDGGAEEPGQKKFSQTAGRGLSKVISIAPDGSATEHWQTRDRALAWKLAEFLAARLSHGERVIVRRTIEVITRHEVDEPVPPPEAA